MHVKPLAATRRIQFCAGHRVYKHESKCHSPHGHNYVAQFTAVRYDTDTRLDELGRVIDFSVLKDAIGGWIDEHWDHGFIIWDEDNELGDALETIPDQKLFRLDYNPTAENMAYYLLTVVCPHVLRETGVRVVKVRLWETENCYAEAE